MASKTRFLSFIAAALVALTTVVAAKTGPALFRPADLAITVEISAKAGAGAATSWQAP